MWREQDYWLRKQDIILFPGNLGREIVRGRRGTQKWPRACLFPGRNRTHCHRLVEASSQDPYRMESGRRMSSESWPTQFLRLLLDGYRAILVVTAHPSSWLERPRGRRRSTCCPTRRSRADRTCPAVGTAMPTPARVSSVRRTAPYGCSLGLHRGRAQGADSFPQYNFTVTSVKPGERYAARVWVPQQGSLRPGDRRSVWSFSMPPAPDCRGSTANRLAADRTAGRNSRSRATSRRRRSK